MKEGWIKLHRKLLDSPVFSNPKLLKVWVWCLLKASHEPYEVIIGLQTVGISRGQFVFGLNKASSELDIPIRSLRDYLNALKRNGMVAIKTTNKYSVLTVENYDFYQDCSTKNGELTANKPQTNRNIQEEKENNKKPYGEFQNVRLTDIELGKLKEKFPQDYKDRIEKLSAYKRSKGKRYKSDYATILNWARMEEHKDGKKGAEKIDW